jgi:hypothetical protein
MVHCELCIQVTATDLLEVCMTHLSSAIEVQAEAALGAVNSICDMPMIPSQRTALQQRLLAFLASSSDLAQRPLMRARVAHAVFVNSRIDLLELEQETCSVMHVRFRSISQQTPVCMHSTHVLPRFSSIFSQCTLPSTTAQLQTNMRMTTVGDRAS